MRVKIPKAVLLIRHFCFAYADCWFSGAAAQFVYITFHLSVLLFFLTHYYIFIIKYSNTVVYNQKLIITISLYPVLSLEKSVNRVMIKPTFCIICENKGADQRISLRYTHGTSPLFLNQRFPVSRHFPCLYSSVCVGPGRKHNCFVLFRFFRTRLKYSLLFL